MRRLQEPNTCTTLCSWAVCYHLDTGNPLHGNSWWFKRDNWQTLWSLNVLWQELHMSQANAWCETNATWQWLRSSPWRVREVCCKVQMQPPSWIWFLVWSAFSVRQPTKRWHPLSFITAMQHRQFSVCLSTVVLRVFLLSCVRLLSCFFLSLVLAVMLNSPLVCYFLNSHSPHCTQDASPKVLFLLQ